MCRMDLKVHFGLVTFLVLSILVLDMSGQSEDSDSGDETLTYDHERSVFDQSMTVLDFDLNNE